MKANGIGTIVLYYEIVIIYFIVKPRGGSEGYGENGTQPKNKDGNRG